LPAGARLALRGDPRRLAPEPARADRGAAAAGAAIPVRPACPPVGSPQARRRGAVLLAGEVSVARTRADRRPAAVAPRLLHALRERGAVPCPPRPAPRAAAGAVATGADGRGRGDRRDDLPGHRRAVHRDRADRLPVL